MTLSSASQRARRERASASGASSDVPGRPAWDAPAGRGPSATRSAGWRGGLSAVATLIRPQRADSLATRVATLAAGPRDCLLLRECDRLSVAAIAAELGASPEQVRDWL